MIDANVCEQLLAALREMLSNVARHAAATAATVSVSVNTDVVVTVADNGTGPPPEVVNGRVCRICAPEPKPSTAHSPWKPHATMAPSPHYGSLWCRHRRRPTHVRMPYVEAARARRRARNLGHNADAAEPQLRRWRLT